MRNTRRELNDIRFEFQPSKVSWETGGVCFYQSFFPIQDSADGIANELLTAGLIVGDDLVAMAANLDKLISTPPSSKQLCFRISSGIAQQETPDERALLGESSNWGLRSTKFSMFYNCRLCTVEYRGLGTGWKQEYFGGKELSTTDCHKLSFLSKTLF